MKFKVGDLVTLSAAGRRMEQNSCVFCGFGIVVLIGDRRDFPITCQWFSGDRSDYWFKEYELKRYRGEK